MNKHSLVATVTVTSKGQITIPAAMSRRLGLTRGDQIDIYPVGHNRFAAVVRHASRIMDYAGDLAALHQERRERRDRPKR